MTTATFSSENFASKGSISPKDGFTSTIDANTRPRKNPFFVHQQTGDTLTTELCTSPQAIVYQKISDSGSQKDEEGNQWTCNGTISSDDADTDTNVASTETLPQRRISDYLPVAYSFLGSEEAVRERLSSNLHLDASKSQEKSSNESQSVSTWSSKAPPTQRDGDFFKESNVNSLYSSSRDFPRHSMSTDSPQLVSPARQLEASYRLPANLNAGISTSMANGASAATTQTDSRPYAQSSAAPIRPIPEHSRSSGNISAFSDLSNSGSTHFGPGLRAKLNTVLPLLLNTVPIGPSRTVMIAEYGCMNSRAIHLLRTVLEQLATIAFAVKPGSVAIAESQGSTVSIPSHRATMAGLAKETADVINFVIVHEDVAQSDFRWFQQVLDTHPESYLDPLWQSSQNPPLQNAIFSSCVARPFGSRIVPPDSLNLGFSLMDLHWTHSPATDISLHTIAHAELTLCLNARAREFRRGGVFVLAYIARTENTIPESDIGRAHTRTNSLQSDMGSVDVSRTTMSPTSISEQDAPVQSGATLPNSGKHPRDIWTVMSNMIVPCLQRLVSCGMMKIDVARYMFTLPMHPRTSSQTLQVLEKFSEIWSLDWSCGLGRSETREITTELGEVVILQSEPDTLRMPQPAKMALKSGKIPPSAYNEHVINMFKNLYEAHFRQVLRERGKLNKGAAEFILDSLWDVLRSRLGDPSTCPLADCELEVQLFALRRL